MLLVDSLPDGLAESQLPVGIYGGRTFQQPEQYHGDH